VNPDPSAPDLRSWLGAFSEHAAPFAMETYAVTHRSSHEIGCNWKVYAENYQEGYHIPIVHRSLNRTIDASRYRVEVAGAVAVHSAPTRDGAVTDGAWLWRFPGLALNLYPSGLSLESFWPTGPTTTRIEYTFCFAPGTSEEEAQAAVDISLAILEEDRDICEAVQRTLASGLALPGILSPRHERGVGLVRDLVAGALARP
jgi:choline monooxygenase